MDRLKRLQQHMNELNLDAFLVSNPNNVYYLSQIKSSNAYILVIKDKMIFFTDGRYLESAKQISKGAFDVIAIDSLGIVQNIKEQAANHNIKKFGFEGNTMSFDQAQKLLAQDSYTFISSNIDSIRCQKDENELSYIRKAVQIADEAFEAVALKIEVGMTERNIEHLLLNELLSRGASGFSFSTIVASGERGALPHGVATDKVIEATDMITIDFGAVYHGYVSDITRTIAMSSQVDPKLIEIFETVKKAHDLAVAAAKPGIACSELDRIAREHIISCGYQEYFIHGLGHSFGLEIHEQPFVNANNHSILLPNTVITVEPGIYVPGLGGVRIESDVLITQEGYEKLSNSDHGLRYIQEESK